MRLQRLAQTSAATCGRLFSDTNDELCKTLELPWRENATGISCIPAAHYTARRRFSPAHRCDVFEIEHVPNRQDIEIHRGNTTKDTRLMTVLRGIDSFAIQIIDVDGKQQVLA